MGFIYFNNIISICNNYCFSSDDILISWQAIQLGMLLKLRIIHTSACRIGQVYIPIINFILFMMIIITILIFENSDNLASAYGITVIFNMIITTLLSGYLAIHECDWPRLLVLSIFISLFLLEFIFFITVIDRIFIGAWLPILLTIIVYIIINNWLRGKKLLNNKILINHNLKLAQAKIPVSAIFIYNEDEHFSTSLDAQLKHNKFIHQQTILLAINVTHEARVGKEKRFRFIESINQNHNLQINYGFFEIIDLTKIIRQLSKKFKLDCNDLTIFLGKSIPVISGDMNFSWQKNYLFSCLKIQ